MALRGTAAIATRQAGTCWVWPSRLCAAARNMTFAYSAAAAKVALVKRVNAVVVGAGAAGGIVAKELATAGLSVVLLERGKWYTAADCRKDDLRNQRTTRSGQCLWPGRPGQSARLGRFQNGTAHTVLPSEGAYQNNAACVGGGTLSYGAQAWRYMPQDFKMRSTYGAPAGSSLEDWPITYDDLEPFYDKAEYEIGVSGDYSGTPFHGPRASRSAHGAAATQSRIRHSGARGKAPRTSSISFADAAQQRAL